MRAILGIEQFKQQVNEVQSLIEYHYIAEQKLKPIMKEINMSLKPHQYINGGIIDYICSQPARIKDMRRMIAYALELFPQMAYRLVVGHTQLHLNIARELRGRIEYVVGLDVVYSLCLAELIKHQELVEMYLINTFLLPYRTCKEVNSTDLQSFLNKAYNLYGISMLNKYQRRKAAILKIFAGLYQFMDKDGINKTLTILAKGKAKLNDFINIMDNMDISRYDNNLYTHIKAKLLLEELKNN